MYKQVENPINRNQPDKHYYVTLPIFREKKSVKNPYINSLSDGVFNPLLHDKTKVVTNAIIQLQPVEEKLEIARNHIEYFKNVMRASREDGNERGGWIVYNTVTKVIKIQKVIKGGPLGGALPHPPDLSANEVLGKFHTHPGLHANACHPSTDDLANVISNAEGFEFYFVITPYRRNLQAGAAQNRSNWKGEWMRFCTGKYDEARKGFPLNDDGNVDLGIESIVVHSLHYTPGVKNPYLKRDIHL